jgi:hypothetical protein
MSPARSVIAFTGAAGAGKSTAAAHLAAAHGYAVESFAAPIKDAVSAVFGWDRGLLEGDTDSSRAWRESVDPWWAARLRMPNLTPRLALQLIGTEAMRDAFHLDIWIASMQRRLLKSDGPVVVGDVRFPNESDALRTFGGIVVRIERPGTAPGAHRSEACAVEPDYVVVNDGSPEAFYKRLDELLEKVRRDEDVDACEGRDAARSAVAMQPVRHRSERFL